MLGESEALKSIRNFVNGAEVILYTKRGDNMGA